MKDFLFIDFETRSFSDLPNVGAWVYSEHETTAVICMAYRLNDGEVETWLPGQNIPDVFKRDDIFYVARNALFEYAICYNVLCKKYSFTDRLKDVNNWICTRAMSTMAGLPGDLENSAKILNVTHQKLESGNYLINKYSKPAKKKDGTLYFRDFKNGEFDEMIKYNVYDVLADSEIFYKLYPLNNNKLERDIFLYDFKQNVEGVLVDTESLNKIIYVLDEATKKAEKDMKKYGVNVRSTKQLLEYLDSKGIKVSNIQKKTIDNIISNVKDTEVLKILELRQFLGKASTKKYNALLQRVAKDNTIKYMLSFNGAHTGRWSANGFQPHNLPKSGVDPDNIEAIINNFDTYNNYSELIQNAKKVLPAMLIARDKNIFLLGDFSAIEARGVAYLSGQLDLLDMFKNNKDVYIDMASTVYGVKPNQITPKQRKLGKQIILGCGYGMGVNTVIENCKKYNIDINPMLAALAVKSYRKKYNKIQKFWYDCQKAFRDCIGKNITKTVGYIEFIGNGKSVIIKLPSNRLLYYHNAYIKKGDCYYINYRQKKLKSKPYRSVKIWGGILVENIVQAMCRDILKECLLECVKSGLNPVLHVHDEIVIETNNINEDKEKFLNIMNSAPEWAKGFPLSTEITESKRYYK